MKIIRSDNFFSKAFNSTHLTLPHSFFPRPSICNRLDRVDNNRVFVGFTLCNIRHDGLEILSYASWIFERCKFPLPSSLHTFISRSNSIDLGSICVKRSVLYHFSSPISGILFLALLRAPLCHTRVLELAILNYA